MVTSKQTVGKNLKELEAYWRARVRQAHRRYRDAVERNGRTADELGQRSSEEPNGSFAVAKAMRAEAWARRELVRVTHIYSDLVVRHITPPPDDGEGLIGFTCHF